VTRTSFSCRSSARGYSNPDSKLIAPVMPTAREFKVVLQELEDELGDISQDVQHLQKFSVDAISFEARECMLKQPLHAFRR